MNFEKVVSAVQRLGFPTVIAGLLLYFLYVLVIDKVNAQDLKMDLHVQVTASNQDKMLATMRQTCIAVNVIAKRDASACLGEGTRP